MVLMLKFKKILKIARFCEMASGGHCSTNRKVAGSITDGNLILGIYSASNINEYQECFSGKAAGA